MKVALCCAFCSGYSLCEALHDMLYGHAGFTFVNLGLAFLNGSLAYLNYSAAKNETKP